MDSQQGRTAQKKEKEGEEEEWIGKTEWRGEDLLIYYRNMTKRYMYR